MAQSLQQCLLCLLLVVKQNLFLKVINFVLWFSQCSKIGKKCGVTSPEVVVKVLRIVLI